MKRRAVIAAGALLVAAAAGAFAVTGFAAEHAHVAVRQPPAAPAGGAVPAGGTGGAVPAAAAAVTRQAPAAPARLLTGVYAKGMYGGYASVADFAALTGSRPGIVAYFSDFSTNFLWGFAGRARASGAIPMVQLEPRGVRLSGIAAGRYDRFLEGYARSVAGFRFPVIISFAHEMNGNWYPWGYGTDKPSVFVAAWRHVVRVFRAAGASNVIWVWDVNAYTVPGTTIAAWWPGASYVTWTGVTGYYFTPHETFAGVFLAALRQLRGFGKPILIAETGVGPSGYRAAQITGLMTGARSSGLAGVVYFDTAQHDPPYHLDWDIDRDPAALRAFGNGAGPARVLQCRTYRTGSGPCRSGILEAC